MATAKPTILVIDDDPAICSLLGEVLGDAGYAVETASDGDAGRARLARGGLDLLLLDRTLPGQDGLEFCRTVRRQEVGASTHLPIILFTAATGDSETRAAVEAGADAFLRKPFDLAALLEHVSHGIGGDSPAAQQTRT
jgi:DNA-binding response OmpR family regulator